MSTADPIRSVVLLILVLVLVLGLVLVLVIVLELELESVFVSELVVVLASCVAGTPVRDYVL